MVCQTAAWLKEHGYFVLWAADVDSGVRDMYAYCSDTLSGSASPGQREVCSAVPGGACHEQADPAHGKAHGTFVDWGRWLLTNFSLNPGTIYADSMALSVAEVEGMVPLGLNSYTVMQATCKVGAHGSDGDPFNKTELLRCAKARADAIAPYMAEMDAKNLTWLASIYGYDESDMMDQMAAEFGYYKQRFPAVKTFTTAHMCGTPKPGQWRVPQVPCGCTEPCPKYPPPKFGVPVQDAARIKALNVDLMCPILDWLKPDNVSDCVDKGLEMWMYTSLEPRQPFLNFRLDNSLWQSRLLFWQSAQLRMTGFLYWGLNYWYHPSVGAPTHAPIDTDAMAGPFVPHSAWDLVYTLGGKPDPNNVGDGQLTYAGSGGTPLASTRLHAVRDGLEDFGYLELLRAVGGDAAVAKATAGLVDPADLTVHIAGTEKDLARMMARRTTVAEAIVALL